MEKIFYQTQLILPANKFDKEEYNKFFSYINQFSYKNEITKFKRAADIFKHNYYVVEQRRYNEKEFEKKFQDYLKENNLYFDNHNDYKMALFEEKLAYSDNYSDLTIKFMNYFLDDYKNKNELINITDLKEIINNLSYNDEINDFIYDTIKEKYKNCINYNNKIKFDNSDNMYNEYYYDFQKFCDDLHQLKLDNPDTEEFNYNKLLKDLFEANDNFSETNMNFPFELLENPTIEDYKWYINLLPTAIKNSYGQNDRMAIKRYDTVMAVEENLKSFLKNKIIKNITPEQKIELIKLTFDTHKKVIKNYLSDEKYLTKKDIELTKEYLININFDFVRNSPVSNFGINYELSYKIGDFMREIVIENNFSNSRGFLNFVNENLTGLFSNAEYTKFINAFNIKSLGMFKEIIPSLVESQEYYKICLNATNDIKFFYNYDGNELIKNSVFTYIDTSKILEHPKGKERVLKLLENSLLKIIEYAKDDKDCLNAIKKYDILNYENREKNFNSEKNCNFKLLDEKKCKELFDNAKKHIDDYSKKIDRINKITQKLKNQPVNLSKIPGVK